MHFLTVDNVSLVAALVLQAALAFTLIRRGLARFYPVFLLYMLLNLVEDPVGWALQSSASDGLYLRYYFVVTILDYVLQLLILLEIARNVIRPSKRSIPFPVAPVAIVGVLLCALIAASFSPQVQLIGLGHTREILIRVSLLLAILKILLFVTLAVFAQVLGIGWKSHVLQLASGFAFYGAVSLMVQLSSTRVAGSDNTSYVIHLTRLAQIQSAAYNFTLIFWIWAFSRNEAQRKDFTPQMQEVLVTIAESAKRTRLAVTRSSDRK
jgi:hypothetical protein